MAQQVTKEKHVVDAQGNEHHSVTTEVKDGRSLGDKLHDAKEALKDKPTEQVTKEKHVVEEGKVSHKIESETRDPRTLGDKLADAKDAFTGKH
ncbi:hypothetical protein RvY_17964 [Ramazzottius varieornatus]|uniref:Uncharacterized protein n=1 Tax=Ramazzottius varieornatus TaxID=947166 RepID=A0A1D1W425_RAMVA|nr:hypothetical protein RvY_17964 [Ramazzottius varieornatus]